MSTRFFRIAILIFALALSMLACGLVANTPVADESIAPTEIVENAKPTSEAPTEVPPTKAVPEPTHAPQIPLGEEQRSEKGGYAFLAVPDYVLEENEGYALMIAPDGDAQNGPAIFMMGGTRYESLTLDGLYDEQIQNFGSGVDVSLSEPRDVTVGGAPGRSVEISGMNDEGQAVSGRITIVLVNPNQTFLMGAMSPEGRWEEISGLYAAIIDTVAFFEPEAVGGQPEVVQPQGDALRQWARWAYASSSYGDPDWHASQAAGAPDTSVTECEDLPTAWASEGSDTLEWLELVYETPVIPTAINIIQTHSPDQVVKVELIDQAGLYQEVYTAEPVDRWEECPYTLSIPVEVDYAAGGLKITIDQSVIGTPWNEIDAVELVGFPIDGTDIRAPEAENTPQNPAEGISLQDPPENSPETGQISDRLFELGYEICLPSDYYNAQTESAVKAFQEANGLPVDGIVDAATWESLFSPQAVPAPLPSSAVDLEFSEPLEGVHVDKIASSGDLLWALTRHYNFLEAYDTEKADYAGIFNVTALPGEEDYTLQALAFDREKLWIASQGAYDAILQAYDPNVDPVVGVLTPLLPESIRLQDAVFVRGLTYDGANLWVSYETFYISTVLAEIDPLSGEILQQIELGFGDYASVPALVWERLWAVLEGVSSGYAVRSIDIPSGSLDEPIGVCGYQVASDLRSLWIAKEAEVWVVDSSSGEVLGTAQFESNIKDITFSGARIYLLFWDGSVRFIQVY